MTADEPRRAFHVPAVVMQVAAAQRGRGDFEDGIGGFLQGGVGAVFYSDLAWLLVSATRISSGYIGWRVDIVVDDR